MDPANYQPCGARLSQGDIAIAPIGVFASVDDLDDPGQLDKVGAVLSAEDPDGVALAIPARGPLGEDPIVLRAWYRPALVLSADCVIQRADEVLIAPIHPLDDAEPRSWDGIRAGRFRTALYLPPDPAMEFPDGSQAPWPESYVDLDRTTSASPRLLHPARLAMLSPDGHDRLQFLLARYLVANVLRPTQG